MKETDVRVALDLILKSDDNISIEMRRAILEEIIDQFQDVMRDLKLPPGITWDGFSIDGDAFPGDERKVLKQGWTDLAIIGRGVGKTPDPRRRG
jgi:hypothetical protein